MKIATEGHFTTEIMQLGANDAETFSGIVSLCKSERKLSCYSNPLFTGRYSLQIDILDVVSAIAIAMPSLSLQLVLRT